jgi:hypothetical protein
MTSTSKWRKQETFKSNTNPSSKTENFSNIPMFDVLNNTENTNNENSIKDNNSETPIIEGFDWQGIDYFHARGIYNTAVDSSKIKEYIEKIMSYFSSPIANVDEMLEKFIYNMLIAAFMINNKACSNKSVSKIINSGDKAEQAFFWLKGRTEGFSLQEQPYLIKTVDSFEKNHKDFITDNDTKMKVGTYYINSLNSYETKIRRRFNENELFLFNNDFDNLLNDPIVQNKIKGIVPNKEWSSQFSSESKPLYQNTEDDYKKYYATYARFKMDNTDMFSYHILNDSYFPIPTYTSNNKTNKKGIDMFNDAINVYEYENSLLTRFELGRFNTKYKYIGLSFKAVTSTPPDFTSSSESDMKYVFSVDTNNTKTEPIQDYLSYVIKYFSLFIFSGLSESDRTLGFQDIEARVGTLYTNLLNRLDFLQYNQYQDYLDSYRISIFNHIFFILIQQTGSGIYDVQTTNKYFQLALDNQPNKINSNEVFQKIIEGNNKRYLKIRSQEDLDKMSMTSVDVNQFPSLVNLTSVSNIADTLSTNYDTRELPISTELNPFIDNKDINLQNLLKTTSLPTYILNNNVKSKEMIKYYMPGQLSECERMKRSVRNEFTNYAKIIKKEIYRLILIPIVLYIVYNIYYMFLFKDAAGRVKYENGEYINKGFACKNPMFPDWESYFHSYDKHATDYILEYVFKPAKIMYTLLNAFKVIIRTFPIIGTDANLIPPYIFLFATLLIFNRIAKKYGESIMSFYNNFFNTWSLPNSRTWNRWKDLARTITIIFCVLTGVKDIAGFDWHETLQLFAVSEAAAGLSDKEPTPRSWLGFLAAAPTSMFFLFFKIIIFILYWLFKYYVAIQMIPLGIFITVIYFTYTVVFAVYNNCDSECDYSSKTELIDRIIYTKLYDVPKKLEKWYDWGLYIFKTVCWLLMVYMFELLTVWMMSKGLNKITSSIGGSKYADGLRLFLIVIYSCIFCLIGLWCFYKYKFKLPIMETFFSNQKDDPEPPQKPPDDPGNMDGKSEEEIKEKYETTYSDYILKTGEKIMKDAEGNVLKDDAGNDKKEDINIFNRPKYLSDVNKYRKYMKIKQAQDKRFRLEKKTNCDTYEILTENKPLRIILGSDILNNIIIKEEIEKKKKLAEDNKGKPSLIDEWSGKIFGTMGNIGDRILQKGQNIMDDLERSNKESSTDNPTLLTAVKDMGKFATEGMDLSKPSTLLSAPFKRLGNAGKAGIGASFNAIKATPGAIGSASSGVLTSVRNSAALLNEQGKLMLPSFMR